MKKLIVLAILVSTLLMGCLPQDACPNKYMREHNGSPKGKFNPNRRY